jgi:hypothetical protein
MELHIAGLLIWGYIKCSRLWLRKATMIIYARYTVIQKNDLYILATIQGYRDCAGKCTLLALFCEKTIKSVLVRADIDRIQKSFMGQPVHLVYPVKQWSKYIIV